MEVVKKALTVNEARAVTGIGKNSLYAMLQAGRIRSVRIGKRFLIPVSAIDEFLSQRAE